MFDYYFFATVGICICVLLSFERISISHFFFPLFPRFLYIYILNISVDSHACVWMCFSGLTGKEREFEDVRAAAVGVAEFEQTGRTRKEIESKSSIFFIIKKTLLIPPLSPLQALFVFFYCNFYEGDPVGIFYF